MIPSIPFSVSPVRESDSAQPFGDRDGARGISVTHVSTSDVMGGAARAAQRLHHALPEVGAQSCMFVAQRFGSEAGVVEFNALTPAPAMFGRTLFRLGRRWHRPRVGRAGAYFSPDWSFTGWRLPSQLPSCDIVNLHWVADLLDYRSLPNLAARCPIVWTFHDMNAFTGGCHYSGACQRFQSACGSCPQLLTSSGERDMTRRILRRKERVLARVPAKRLTVVCPSHWLATQTKTSALFGRFDVRVIPNGVDLQDYHPQDRTSARRQLGLPSEARIVLFVADSIADRRKGLSLLLKAFELIRDLRDLLLVTLGRGGDSLPRQASARHLGALHDTGKLRAAYSAADIFAIPSLQDNLPNTILESMACGTPVAGFNAGGVGEAVIDGQTGLLAPTGDAEALARVLGLMLENERLRQKFGAESRVRAEQEYAVGLQARRYVSLYEEVLQTPWAASAREKSLRSR